MNDRMDNDCPTTKLELLKETFLWAREEGIAIHRIEIAFGRIVLETTDLKIVAPGLPRSGEHDDDRDRTAPPPQSYYEQYARTHRRKHREDDDE